MNGDEQAGRSTGDGVDRRKFLLGTAGVGTVLALGPARAALAAPLPKPPVKLARSVFTPVVGKYFWVQATFIRTTLVEIEDLSGAPAGDENGFSLIFSSPNPFRAGLINLNNLQLGTVSLFVSAVDRGAKNHFYQAVVNRLA